MCGINGFNWEDRNLIREMNMRLNHRGPDAEGILIDQGISLGHVRLSILDLSERGNQPMFNADKTVCIIYNGEIYNFMDLRKNLENEGYCFNSSSDTEVILRAYEKDGIDCIKEFNGIFAFCIYDVKEQCLYLGRDRLGIKPLYYFHDKDKFIFSSEIKGFFAIRDMPLSLDEMAIAEYFLTDNVYAEGFLIDIHAVNPASYIKFDLGNRRLQEREYWNIHEAICARQYFLKSKKSETALIEDLDRLLNDVVKDQLISDAPLGAICSGGVDSSLITAIASQYVPHLKIFNVSVSEKDYDESAYARRIAQHLRLDLIEEALDKNKYLEHFKSCIYHEDLPLMHPNSVGVYLISKRAKKEGVSVLLSGEGADELFGGYPRYREYYKKWRINSVPAFQYLLKKISAYALDFDSRGRPVDNIVHFLRYSSINPGFNRKNDIQQHFREALKFIDNGVERELQSYILRDLRYYVIPLLRRTDRMSMAAGIEMRIPYLDNRLVDFAVNLPLRYKVRPTETKYLLKKVAERYLPQEIVYRSKKGFPMPVEKWFETETLKGFMYQEWQKQIVCHHLS